MWYPLMHLFRIERALPDRNPDKFHLVSKAELRTLSLRLFNLVHDVIPDGRPVLYDSVRKRKYYISANSLHPLKQEAKTIQLFALVATSEFMK